VLGCFECGANARALEDDGGSVKFFEGLKGVVSHMRTHQQWNQVPTEQLKEKIIGRSLMTVNQAQAYSNAKKGKSCKIHLRFQVKTHVSDGIIVKDDFEVHAKVAVRDVKKKRSAHIDDHNGGSSPRAKAKARSRASSR
jgi:hypothetical protein